MTLSPIRIWGRASAFNVQKALWALAECGRAFERIEAGGAAGGLDQPAFVAMNPVGRIPVIDDGGTVVWESNAVVRYLAARYAAGTLWAIDPGERSQADRWMDWFQNHLYRNFMDLFWALVRTPAADRDGARIEALVARSAEGYALLDRHLERHAFVAGDAFTIGDIPVGTSAYRYFEMDIARPALPNVERWYRELATRPGYRAHVMLPFDDLAGRTTF